MPEQVHRQVEAPRATTGLGHERILYFDPKLIGWSSFLFAALQSVCSAFIALGSVRLLIGIGAFTAQRWSAGPVEPSHSQSAWLFSVRIPMMIFALAGSLLNLVVLWQVWRLQRRPAAAWRLQPQSKRKKASVWLQFTLSIITLFLLAAEFVAHRILFPGR